MTEKLPGSSTIGLTKKQNPPLTNGKRADIMSYRINKKHVEEKSKLWKAPERDTFAESILVESS